MNIEKLVRKSFYQGVYMYATVEAVSLGRVVVRLTENGARLTNLSVIGALPHAGDRVIIDYSAGTPPAARLLGGK